MNKLLRPMHHFTNNLNRLMHANEIKAKELAEVFEKPESYVKDCLANKQPFTLDEIVFLTRCFDVTFEELLYASDILNVSPQLEKPSVSENDVLLKAIKKDFDVMTAVISLNSLSVKDQVSIRRSMKEICDLVENSAKEAAQ